MQASPETFYVEPLGAEPAVETKTPLSLYGTAELFTLTETKVDGPGGRFYPQRDLEVYRENMPSIRGVVCTFNVRPAYATQLL